MTEVSAMMRAGRGLALGFVMFCAGCGDATISAGEFDRSCMVDTDCVAVGVGDLCACSCEQGAINAKDLPQYQERRGDISCSNQCGPCPELGEAFCEKGTCALR